MSEPLEIKQEALRLIQETEAREGLQRFIYKGRCMSPALQDEDLLLVKKTPARDLKTGDIVLFRSEGKLWVHRYLYREKASGAPDRLFTKADNTLKQDLPFTEEELIGTVHESRRQNRRFSFKRGPGAVISFLVGVTALCEAHGFTFLLQVRRLLQGKLRLPWRIRTLFRAAASLPKALLVRLFILLCGAQKK